MRIDRLTAEHASEYRSLMLMAYEQAFDAFTSTAEERAAEPLSWWVNRIASPDSMSIAFGAFQGEKLVGTVAVEFSKKPKTRHKALIIGMFVMGTDRGLGAGRALVQAAIEHAGSRPGVLVVTLTVTEGNVPATTLYVSCGFRPFGVEPMAILTPSGFKSKVHTWLSLSNESPEA